MSTEPRPLWQPSAATINEARITEFKHKVEADWGVSLTDTRALWQFSVTELEKFWDSVWDYAEIIAETKGDRVLYQGKLNPWKTPCVMAGVLRREGKVFRYFS